MTKTYMELIRFDTFEDRFNYLKLNGIVAESTFGGHRLLNQMLYKSSAWQEVRKRVIIRDMGCDLGILERPISAPQRILIHHINPIDIDQVTNNDPMVFDLNNLITVSHNTHNAIHYGDESKLMPTDIIERSPFDTAPWRKSDE